MITYNTDGNLISQEFIDNIRSDSPAVIARLHMGNDFLDGAITAITVTKGSCGAEEFTLGGVMGDSLTATVKGMTADVKGQQIECWVGAYVNGAYEYISLGIFTVSEAKKTRYETNITAYSGIIANTVDAFDYDALDTYAIADIITALETQMGCTITCDDGIDTTLEVTSLPSELTLYSMLEVVANVCGGYAVNTNDGNILIKQYNSTPTLSVNTGMMIKLPEIEEEAFTVDGVVCIVEGEEVESEDDESVESTAYVNQRRALIATSDGDEYDLTDENGNILLANTSVSDETSLVYECEYMNAEIFYKNVSAILGYSFYPATIDLTLGDPRLEGSDVLSVIDVDGTAYPVPCHGITFSYQTGLSAQIMAVRPTMISSNVGTTLPITKKIQNVEEKATEALGVASNTNQYFWFTSRGEDTGAHITDIPRDLFLSDPENGGGNLLARSNGIALRNGLDELATFTQTGATIGKTDDFHLSMTQKDMTFAKGDVYAGFNLDVETSEEGQEEPYLMIKSGSSNGMTSSGIFFANEISETDGDTINKHIKRLLYLSSYYEGGEPLTYATFTTSVFEVLLDNGTMLTVDEDDGLMVQGFVGTPPYLSAYCLDTGVNVALHVGTGGYNHGVYSVGDNNWIIYQNIDMQIVIPNAGNETVSSAANVNITSGGLLRRYASSSRRYKKEIADLKRSEIQSEKLYDARVVQFKYRKDYLHDTDLRYEKYIPGFIVEELEEVYPIAVDYDEGVAEDWNARYLIPPMLDLIQKQKKSIDALSERVDTLEAKHEE